MKILLLKFLKLSKVSGGFTLIELLVAMAITSIVLSIAGVGLVAITKENVKAEDETSRRVELNRALDFIADEVRMSKSITLDASTVAFTTEAGATNVQKILALQVSGVSNPIVYYIASPPTNSVWSGSRVIYRWGPDLDSNGEYSSPGTNSNQVLVDLINDSQPNPNPTCSASYSNSNPVDVNDRKGFYACVNTTGSVAQLYLVGKLTNSSGLSHVSSTVFARNTVICTVPNFFNTKADDAQATWTSVGFTTTVTKSGIGNFTINSQTISAGSRKPCSSTITVSPP